MSNQKRNDEPGQRINVAVLGATGVVGQVFVHLLARHRLFYPAVLAGSDTRAGKCYCDEVSWVLPFPIPGDFRDRKISALDINTLKENDVKIVFSALPADVARRVEPELRDCGFYVFSNASALRYDEDVPILIPEANSTALNLIKNQGYPHKGFVAANANCSTTGLAVVLAPLVPLGIKEIFVSTYQSVSGAGYPGLPALDIMNDAVPFISGEEEKIIVEIKKILQLDAAVFPHCVRIPVPFGHLETVWLGFDGDAAVETVRAAWDNFKMEPVGPSFPVQPVQYLEDAGFPRPGLCFHGEPAGQQVFTGRLRKVGDKIGFTLVVNNLVKGAAGGSIQNAELFVAEFGLEG